MLYHQLLPLHIFSKFLTIFDFTPESGDLTELISNFDQKGDSIVIFHFDPGIDPDYQKNHFCKKARFIWNGPQK